jgi:hypothetical protein
MEGLRGFLGTDEDIGRDALRKVSGLLVGTALVLMFIRKSSPELGDTYGDFALLLVLLLTFVFLYGIGLIGSIATGGQGTWYRVYVVFGVIVLPATLLQFLTWIDGSTDAPLNIAWIFLLTAAAGAVGTLVGRVRYALFLASLAVIVAWLAVWDEILSDGVFADLGTLRGLLIIVSALLLAGAVGVYLADRSAFGFQRGSELVTGAAIAAVTAAGISITSFAGLFDEVEGPGIAEASLFWDAVLLIVSLLSIGFGSRFGARGPAYVGGIGLFVFLLVVGFDLDADAPEGKIAGWPLVLFLIGLAGFVVSVIPGLKLGSLGIDRLEEGGGPPTAPPPAGTGAPRPPAGAPPPGGAPPPPGTPPST